LEILTTVAKDLQRASGDLHLDPLGVAVHAPALVVVAVGEAIAVVVGTVGAVFDAGTVARAVAVFAIDEPVAVVVGAVVADLLAGVGIRVCVGIRVRIGVCVGVRIGVCVGVRIGVCGIVCLAGSQAEPDGDR
jgi:hypothetical protein